jgi:hypothetical protein
MGGERRKGGIMVAGIKGEGHCGNVWNEKVAKVGVHGYGGGQTKGAGKRAGRWHASLSQKVSLGFVFDRASACPTRRVSTSTPKMESRQKWNKPTQTK